MLRKFWADKRGNYAMMTVVAMLPLMGALAIAIDYSEMSRQRAQALNALDAAGIATARRYLQGIPEAQLKTFSEEFFKANSNGLDFNNVKLTLVLPDASQTGGGTVKLAADLKYKPYFLPVLTSMLGGNAVTEVAFKAATEVKLKNTIEVALVLDNSGSMSQTGGSSGQVRMALLKTAAKELVATLAKEGEQMKQVPQPVQFSLVPFSSAVNIGPENKDETWMDQDGISPIHHENFDWDSMSSSVNSSKYVQKVGGIYYKKGSGWGAEQNKKVTRFSMYDDIKRISGYNFVKTGTQCDKWNWRGQCTRYVDVGYDDPVYENVAAWKGCVEARPSPYDADDTAPTPTTPATLFVPMFAPDEPGIRELPDDGISATAYNSWWDDGTPGLISALFQYQRQMYMPKYFLPKETSGEYLRSDGQYVGPNQSCGTTPITPLTDVTQQTGKTKIERAIDDMVASGATNVPEGMAWGWRTLSSTAPFTDGRPETERGNDKVVIVVTDGANTYYTAESLGYPDPAGNKSTYSALGYVRMVGNPSEYGRLFKGTSTDIGKTTYTNSNYSNGMNEHFVQLCNNAKAKKIMVMTVALDLDASNAAELKQIQMLTACASDSRYRQGQKLFWNSTGESLANDFKEIGNELSNLRIVF